MKRPFRENLYQYEVYLHQIYKYSTHTSVCDSIDDAIVEGNKDGVPFIVSTEFGLHLHRSNI